jgi:flagellin
MAAEGRWPTRTETLMLSVNTNNGAMIALQYLNNTEASLQQTQNQISTGLKVATAKDNGAIFAIAQDMRGSVAGYQAVTDSLNRGMSTIDVALSAGQSISDLLIQMKQQALAASDTSLNTTSRAAMNANFIALRDQITSIVNNANFNGVNLINGSTTQIAALASSDGTRHVTTAAQNMTLSGTIVTLKSTGNISTQAAASAMIATIQTSLTNVNTALANLSAGSSKFSVQANFVSQLTNALNSGIGNLVDANMAQESAQLTALQTKQQLGAQALAIANQAPQVIMQLFR